MFAPELWGGYDLMVADGTTVTRPEAKGTTARVLYALHLVDMTIPQQKVTDAHGSESLREFVVKPEQLWIANRGYSNPEDIAHVKDAGAEVLVRVNRGALPLYDVAGRLIDVMDLVRSLEQPWAMTEWTMWVQPADHEPIMGRLCAMRLPDKEAEQARQRLRREYGAEATPGMVEAASWVMEFVTAPPERIPLPKVFWLYRLRWQVEIQIHRDKSIGGIGKLPNFRADTIATWLSAKLLLQQIARKIVSPAVALPPQPPESAAPSMSPSKVRDALRLLHHEIVAEMWRVMVFVDQALRAALNPIALRDVPRAVSAYLEYLSCRNEQTRPKQIERLPAGAAPVPGSEVAPPRAPRGWGTALGATSSRHRCSMVRCSGEVRAKRRGRLSAPTPQPPRPTSERAARGRPASTAACGEELGAWLAPGRRADEEAALA